MPERNNNEVPEKRVSKSFLFSLLIVAAIVGLFMFLFLRGRTNTQTLRPSEVVEKLEDKSIISIDVGEHYTVVDMQGQYVKDITKEASGDNLAQFNLSVSLTYFENAKFDFNFEGVTYSDKTLSEIFAIREVKGNDSFKYTTTDVYATTWWDQWGPTIIMLGGSLILVFFLFSRLATSVGSSNEKAMTFNQSRARKIKNSKTKFIDVAGCDEEKAELQEIVSYLKEPSKFTQFGAKLPKGIFTCW